MLGSEMQISAMQSFPIPYTICVVQRTQSVANRSVRPV